MEKKYFFFDIDGTLTDRSTGEIVPSAREALNRLEENGHFVAIATGRAHYKARKFTESNGCQDLKDIASYVTDTNVNDGIKKACEHFKWI